MCMLFSTFFTLRADLLMKMGLFCQMIDQMSSEEPKKIFGTAER